MPTRADAPTYGDRATPWAVPRSPEPRAAGRGRVSRASPTPDHETRPARRSPAQRSPPLPRPSLVAPALGSRPSKPPEIWGKTRQPSPTDPGVRAPTRLGGGEGSPERTRLGAILAPHVVGEQQSYAGWIPASPAISRFNVSRSSSSRGAAEDPVSPSPALLTGRSPPASATSGPSSPPLTSWCA